MGGRQAGADSAGRRRLERDRRRAGCGLEPANCIDGRKGAALNERALISSVSSSAPVAVILAAGLGTRLKTVHADLPKGLLEIGGEPIIRRSMSALREAGVREHVLVAGWRSDIYREWCGKNSPETRLVENPAYESTGSLRSLVCGIEAARGRDVLIVESDLLYERRAPVRLIEAGKPDAILVSGFTDSRDEVWVQPDAGGNLAHLGKRAIDGKPVLGELVGLSRLSAPLAQALERVSRNLPPTAHYEDGFNALAAAGHSLALVHVPDLAWCEIDDPGHLERARVTVWPRIIAADGGQARIT